MAIEHTLLALLVVLTIAISTWVVWRQRGKSRVTLPSWMANEQVISIENPAEWIVQTLMQDGCEDAPIEVFPKGVTKAGIPVAENERLYGGYWQNMYFSPKAIFFSVEGKMERIPWNSIKELDFGRVPIKYAWKFTTVEDKTYTYIFETDGAPWNVHQVVVEMIEHFGGWDRKAMMPTPTHLRECLRRPDIAISERRGELVAPVMCPCGASEMELLYCGEIVNYDGRPIICVTEIEEKFFLRIEAQCTKCGRRHLLLDKDLHGWNGFVCRDETQAALPRPPFHLWHCVSCQGTAQRMTLTVCTEGKKNFVEDVGEKFGSDRWPDGFGWFTLSTECVTCHFKVKQLVDYETM